MAEAKKQSRFNIKKCVSSQTMSVGEWHTGESLIAKLIARAYAADHPELFGSKLMEVLGSKTSGISSSARAETVAPAAKDDIPENTMERGAAQCK